MKTGLITIVLLLLTVFSSNANFDNYLVNYLEDLKANNISAFYSECKRASGKSALVFPLGKKNGLLVELEKKTVVNLANISIEKSGPLVTDSHGGVYTYARVENLVKDMLSYPFKFVGPDKIGEIITSQPNQVCIDKPPW